MEESSRDRIRARLKQIEADTAARRGNEESEALRAMRKAREGRKGGDLPEPWQTIPLAQVFGESREKGAPRSPEASKADFCARHPDAPREGWQERPEGKTRPIERRPIDSFLDFEERRR